MLAPLQAVIGVVERRQTMPVLANVLLRARDGQLLDHGTDLEVELVASTEVTVQQRRRHHGAGAQAPGYLAGAAREGRGDRCSRRGREAWCVKAAAAASRSRRLPAAEFPVDRGHQCAADGAGRAQGFAAAARKDAFFDGAAGRSLLPERHVAGDRRQDAARGRDRRSSAGAVRNGARRQGRRPRSRSSCRARVCWSCSGSWATEGDVELAIGTNHVRAQIGDVRFTSKLIDGRFPEYSRVIPAPPARRSRRIADVLAPGAAAHRHSVEREISRHPAHVEDESDSRFKPTTLSRKRPRKRSRSVTRAMISRSAST